MYATKADSDNGVGGFENRGVIVCYEALCKQIFGEVYYVKDNGRT